MQKIIKEESFKRKQCLFTRILFSNGEAEWFYKNTEVRTPHHLTLELEKEYVSIYSLDKEMD